MPLICLVRHGQASATAEDYDVLSDLGRTQAAVVGRELARRGLRDPLLVSGTLNGQRDTAVSSRRRPGTRGRCTRTPAGTSTTTWP
ncbi:histidine phosphatase family protein [Streptomyces sp. NPDC032940]|uniref:histidine phosphatase family protein n=1 Tax=Streptomyces sp. NPDC032940 TaxID=3155366 RepID=UPI0034068E92